MKTNITTRFSHEQLCGLLNEVKTIALIGASPKSNRPSYEVMSFLQARGFKITPVNPAIAGKTILREEVVRSIEKLSETVDMIEIFRNSNAAGETCDEILSLPEQRRPKIVWMQVRVVNEAAAAKLNAEGITVVMDECPKRVLQKQENTKKTK